MSRLIRYTIAFLFIYSVSNAYTPPKGIPDPADSFSTFGEIDQDPPSTATKCPDWPSAQTTDCYYIDNSGTCTDTANTYGYPANPRCTIPSLDGLTAGAYVEIVGGGSAYTQAFRPYSIGTAANPTWIVGTSSPTIDANIDFGFSNNAELSYIVLTGFTLNTNRYIDVRPRYASNAIHHIIIRNCTLVGDGTTRSNVSAISLGTGSSVSGSSTQNIVVYNNTISGWGLKEKESADDACAIYGNLVTNLWVLSNTISDIAEDGVAGCHTCYNQTSSRLTNYYIGGNVISDMGANCIDLKEIDTTIISENSCTGPFAKYNNTSNDGGQGIILHYGAGSQPVLNPWVIFNKVYTGNGGIILTSTTNGNIIGNLIYDQNDTEADGSSDYGSGIEIRGSTGSFNIVDNTIYDADEPIHLEGSITAEVHGNVLSNRAEASGHYEVYVQTITNVDLDYNQVYYPSGSAAFYWDGASRSLATMQGTYSECANCAEGDPGFNNAAGGDFRAASGSSAIVDVSVEGPVGGTAYDAFFSAFSINIEKDYNSVSRPQNGIWDIGAYEFNAYTGTGSATGGGSGSMTGGGSGSVTAN